jgi:single-strand DNA-binding protein
MSSYNHVVLMGHLTRDVEIRYTPKGMPIGNIAIAVNRTWKNEAGEKQEEVSFFECIAFGRNAEIAAQYCGKGKPLLLNGRLKQESWDDKETGKKRYAVKVIVEGVQLIGDGEKREAQPQRQPAAEKPAPAEDNDEDVPF